MLKAGYYKFYNRINLFYKNDYIYCISHITQSIKYNNVLKMVCKLLINSGTDGFELNEDNTELYSYTRVPNEWKRKSNSSQI